MVSNKLICKNNLSSLEYIAKVENINTDSFRFEEAVDETKINY
jgi:hypothetical protein